MTMHLLPPMYSTTGKKKGKQKFRNAEAAAKARRNADAWAELLSRYPTNSQIKIKNPISVSYDIPRPTPKHPSLNTSAGSTAKKPVQQYTGTAMIGIGQLHKSNSIPVFQAEDAVDIAKMRRG